MPNAQSYRKYIEFGVLCLLASALLWWFGRNLDWSEVGHAVASSDPFLLIVAVLIISAAYFVRAFRWGALLKPLSAARFSDLFAATTIGFSGVFQDDRVRRSGLTLESLRGSPLLCSPPGIAHTDTEVRASLDGLRHSGNRRHHALGELVWRAAKGDPARFEDYHFNAG